MNIFELKTVIIITAILAGTFLIFLGYKLYALGIQESGDAEVEIHAAKIRLTRFGPGVVLALFGAGLIVFGITRPFTSTTTTKIKKTEPRGNVLSIEETNAENAVFEFERNESVAASSEPAENEAPITRSEENAPPRNR